MANINGTSAGETLWGTSGADNILGYGGSDYIDGGAGNDYVIDNDGQNPDTSADTLLGGDGDDIVLAGLYDNADGGSGYDTLVLALDNTPGSWDIDFSLFWSGVTYTLSGATLQGFERLGWVKGGSYGDRFILGTPAGQTSEASGAGGDDWLIGGAGNDTLVGGSYLYGVMTDTGLDILEGGGGDDHLHGNLGDEFYGDLGTDTLTFDMGAGTSGLNFSLSTLIGTGWITVGGSYIEGIENVGKITGTAFNDVIEASADIGDSIFLGGAGDDAIYGGAGWDTIDGGTGADTMAGGAGHDDYTVDSSGDVIIEAAGGGNDEVFSSITYTLGANLENLYLQGATAINGTGNDLANIIRGNTAANTLNGGLGDDYLQGGDGVDILNGGDGQDSLDGGVGADRLTGGLGNDTYYVDNTGEVLIELAGEGIDLVYSSVTKTLAGNLENMTLTGSDAINGTGNTLDNQIIGNTGANTLTGGVGDDTLYGMDGADTLIGGAGRDYLAGQAGADIFSFAAGDLAGVTTATADRIYDFSHAQGDIIRLNGIDAIDGGTNNAFTFIGTAAFSGVAGQLRYEVVGSDTTVYGDTNGDGIADLALALSGNLTLVAGDFIL